MPLEPLALYLVTGAIAGVLAGLLGVGGGLVIVPVLSFIFAGFGFPEQHLLHLALGTSLATIVVTSVSSARAHHLKQSVDWEVVRRIAPGIAAGCLLGAAIAAQLDTRPLKLLFVVFEFYVGTQILLRLGPHAHRALPGNPVLSAVGVGIGAVSSLVGIGGGTLSVPFLLYCNRGMHAAVGTSAAIGLPIAVFGSLGYVLAGLGKPGLPPLSLGYVHLPALGGIALASLFFAPLGASLAHRLPVLRLKQAFALLLYALGAKMALSLLP